MGNAEEGEPEGRQCGESREDGWNRCMIDSTREGKPEGEAMCRCKGRRIGNER